MTHKEAVRRHFDAAAPLWDRLYDDEAAFTNLKYGVLMRQRLQLAVEAVHLCNPNRPLKVLDLGCGAGKLARALAQRGHSVIGADLSRCMLQRARSTCQAATLPSTTGFVCADAEHLPFPNASFDVACCLGLLEYLKNDERIVEELDRVLQLNGLLVLTVPNFAKLCSLLDPYYYLVRAFDAFRQKSPTNGASHSRLANTVAARRFFLGHLDRLLTPLGYARLSRAPVGFGPFTLWRRPLFSEQRSICWSRNLDRLCSAPGFNWLEFFANRWVFAYRKGPKP